MKQNEIHHIWEKMKPITSDPVIQQKLWNVLLFIIENERNLHTQTVDQHDKN